MACWTRMPAVNSRSTAPMTRSLSSEDFVETVEGREGRLKFVGILFEDQYLASIYGNIALFLKLF